MTDPRTTQGQPSPEEMRAILEQLREVDPAVLVAEAFNMLAQGAQVKLGRPDARPLIDALAGMVQAAGTALPAELSTQMEQAIAQLQMAQVQAERDAAGQPAETGSAEGESDAGPESQGAPDAAGQAGNAAAAPRPPAGPGGQQKMTDRLWVPGRDPRPPGR